MQNKMQASHLPKCQPLRKNQKHDTSQDKNTIEAETAGFMQVCIFLSPTVIFLAKYKASLTKRYLP